MDDEALRLAHLAIEMGATTGCCEWDYDEELRFRRDPEMAPYPPEYIKELLMQFILDGNALQQRKEIRKEYGHREYWYMAIIPHPDFKNGIFVECELIDPDPDVPSVIIFNAHPERK